MDEISGENKIDLSSLVFIQKKKKINRQSNITPEEEQISTSSVEPISKPLISIFLGKTDSDKSNNMSSNSSTLPKYCKERNNYKRINSQKSVNEQNLLSITNNFLDDSNSRKSSFNSVRFSKYETNQNIHNISLDGSNKNYQNDDSIQNNFVILNSGDYLKNHLKLPDYKNENSLVSTLTSKSNSIADFLNDAELLESSVKKNDKYTTRRILDNYFSYFRTKHSDLKKKSILSIPNIFYNILHLSIENDSIDVLRICLKYGLDSNECGTSKTIQTSCNFNCNICKFNKTGSTSSETKIDSVNYCSYNYLITLPPLFLSISKCNHKATHLLLSYGACPNIQDCFNNSPLHVAAAKPNPCYECIYLLLKYHANCLLSNFNKVTPIQILNLVIEEKKIEPTTNWDCTISSIYARIINEIFRNLDLLSQYNIKNNSDLSQSPKNDKLLFLSTNKSTKNLMKSSTVQQNIDLDSCSLKNISKLTSSTSFVNENDSKNEKQLFPIKKILKNQNCGSDANLSLVKRNKNKIKKEILDGKNLITVLEPREKCKSLINFTPNNLINQNIDSNESFLLKKYARYSRSPVNKAGSAVVRTPTFNQSININKISRQTSLSNFMINKLNSIRNINSNYAYGSNRKIPNENFSKQVSKSTDQQLSVINGNHSLTSSKMSLFSKPIISQNQYFKSNKIYLNELNEFDSMKSLYQEHNHNQSTFKKDCQNMPLNLEVIKEKYENAFITIFMELEKFSSNIECVNYIIDELQFHVKDFLDITSFRDEIAQTQFLDSKTNLKNQLNNKLSLPSQLISKLEILLNNLIQTCADELVKMEECSTNQKTKRNYKSVDLEHSNYLEKLDSIKNKRFQSLTRKLIEISKDLLDNTQLPSIQYIALSTINKIFDINVYYNLFYPGYYESCYIPGFKRTNVCNNLNRETVKCENEKEVSKNINFIQLKKPNRTLKYCSCKSNSRPYNINNLSKIKERNSTIQEDPSSIETQPKINESSHKLEKKGPELSKNSSLNAFTKRIGGFFRILSFNSHYNSNSDSKLNYESKTELICQQCRKILVPERKNSKIFSMLHLKSVEICENGDCEENEEKKEKEATFNYINSILINQKVKELKFEEKKIENSDLNSYYLNQPIKILASSFDPKFLLEIIHERLESHKSIDINATTAMSSILPQSNTCGNCSNSKIKCLPSARTMQCQHHCVAILSTRLFTILCNEQVFQTKLMNEHQQVCFNLIVDILYPNNDPHLLCLLLQGLGILALKPEYHDTLLKFDLPDTIMSLILPGDELFYTNQTTKYPKYVKYLAARILVYLGLFEKVSNKVNLFDVLEMNAEKIDLQKPNSFENNFIHSMAIGENTVISDCHLNFTSIRIEKVLDNILKEIQNKTTEKIKFNLNENSNNLEYNMSYLCTLVHPLIIIRLLEHRLFTPLLKKSNTRESSSFNLFENLKSIPTSTSFPSNNQLCDPACKNLKPRQNRNSIRKCSEGLHERSNIRKESQLSLCDKQQSNKKTAYLKDLSKKIIKRVNSGNQYGYSNFKKSLKYSRSRKNRNKKKDSSSLDSFNHSTELISSLFLQKENLKSNTNSFDKSCLKEIFNVNEANLSNNLPDFKKLEKKLINLPTFTISDEYATKTLPSSSCLVNEQNFSNLDNTTTSAPFSTVKAKIFKSLVSNEPRRKSDLIEIVKKNVNIFRKRNSLSLNHLNENKNYFNTKRVNKNMTLISKSLCDLSSNIKNIFKKSNDEHKIKYSMTEDANLNLIKDQYYHNQLMAQKNYLHYESNSTIEKIQPKLNYFNNSSFLKNSVNPVGLLPDLKIPTLSSSIDVKSQNNYSLGVVALTTAATTIGSSLILSNKQNEQVSNEFYRIPNYLTNRSLKLTNSSSLSPMPIKIGDNFQKITKTYSNAQINDLEVKSFNKERKANNRIKNKKQNRSSFSSDVINKISNPQVNKHGSEVLNLISLWVKNSPNDFLDSRVLDEIKLFFNQLDSLKSSFRPWTKKLKQILPMEEIEQKEIAIDIINNEEIINQFQIVIIDMLDVKD